MLRKEWLAHLDGLVVFRGLLAAEPLRALRAALAAEENELTGAIAALEAELAGAEGIKVIPTLVLFRNGKAVGSITAPGSKAEIDRFIQEALAK